MNMNIDQRLVDDVLLRLTEEFSNVATCHCGNLMKDANCDNHDFRWNPCSTSQILRDSIDVIMLQRSALKPVDDGAPARERVLQVVRDAFGPKAGHGDCKRYAKGFKCCQICGALDDLKRISVEWKGCQVRLV